MQTGNFEHDTKQAHAKLKELFETPFELQDFAWAQKFYSIVPGAYFEIRGRITDPSGRPYIAAKLADDIHIHQIKLFQNDPNRPIAPGQEMALLSFHGLAHEAANAISGVAIISSEEDRRPDALLRFGSLWSFLEYGDLGGNGTIASLFEKAFAIDPVNPFDVIEEDTETYTISTPSEAFFPSYARDLICQEVSSHFPEAHPTIQLLCLKKYVTSYTILVQANMPDEAKQQFQADLTWYMPPYLPIIVS